MIATNKKIDMINYFDAMKKACQKETNNTKNIFKRIVYKGLCSDINKMLAELKSIEKKRLDSKQMLKCQALVKKAMLISRYKQKDI